MIVFLSVEIISRSHNHSIATAWPTACRCRNLTILIVKFCGYNTGLYVLLRQNNIFFIEICFETFMASETDLSVVVRTGNCLRPKQETKIFSEQ